MKWLKIHIFDVLKGNHRFLAQIRALNWEFGVSEMKQQPSTTNAICRALCRNVFKINGPFHHSPLQSQFTAKYFGYERLFFLSI